MMGLAGNITLGMLLAFLAFRSSFSQRVVSLVDKWFDLKMLDIQARRIGSVLLVPPEAHSDSDNVCALPAEKNVPMIEVRDLWFRYSDLDPWILKGVTLRIIPGESVAITGKSGCGKTTLVRILIGLLTPTKGEILIDGVDLRHYGVRRYRDLIATVMQDDHLLSGTLADNISFFDMSPDFTEVKRCAEMAAVSADIESMPMGYRTYVSGSNSTLSGGQKQRIFLARAFYKKPTVFIFDEATSHLDVPGEQRGNEAISKLNVTRILVAHRAETIRSAHREIQIVDGIALPVERPGKLVNG